MPEEQLHAYAYRILRYTPNLVRDEWVNIGVVIHDPTGKEFRVRLVEELNEFARIRRLHPSADEHLLRALQADFEAQLAAHQDGLSGYIAQLDQTLSNVLQLSPQRGVLAEDLDAEVDRLYRDHVEPPRYRGAAAEAANTSTGIRTRITQVFRSAGILPRVERRFPVDAFTYPGDPCGSIIPTAGTARAGSCRRSRLRATRRRPRCSLTPPSASARSSRRRNSPRSRKLARYPTTSAINLSFACWGTRESSSSPWPGSRGLSAG